MCSADWKTSSGWRWAYTKRARGKMERSRSMRAVCTCLGLLGLWRFVVVVAGAWCWQAGACVCVCGGWGVAEHAAGVRRQAAGGARTGDLMSSGLQPPAAKVTFRRKPVIAARQASASSGAAPSKV